MSPISGPYQHVTDGVHQNITCKTGEKKKLSVASSGKSNQLNEYSALKATIWGGGGVMYLLINSLYFILQD